MKSVWIKGVAKSLQFKGEIHGQARRKEARLFCVELRLLKTIPVQLRDSQ